MCAGYPAKPLAAKLGIKSGFVVAVVHPPDNYRRLLGRIPRNVVVQDRLAEGADIVHAFVKARSEIDREFERWKGSIRPSGCLWVSWPKRVSGVATDLTEQVVRDVALAHGLVNVKVAAIDDTWSGLKLVFRLVDRPPAKGMPSPASPRLGPNGSGARHDDVSPRGRADRGRRDLQDALAPRGRRRGI
jgi:hypothetical protein